MSCASKSSFLCKKLMLNWSEYLEKILLTFIISFWLISVRTGIRTTRKWTRTTRERNKEESKFLAVGYVLNTRRHINIVFTDGPVLYKSPSNIHLQMEIHVHLTSTGWMSTCYKTLQYQNRNARIRYAVVSAFTERQTGSGHSEQNIFFTKTNIKVVLISWNKYIWIIYELFNSYPPPPKRNPSTLQRADG